MTTAGSGRCGRLITTLTLASALALTWVPATITSAQARTTLTVTTTQDSTAKDGTCSLREALANANADAHTFRDCPAGGGLDQIVFDLGRGHHTITLDDQLGALEVAADERVVIDGLSHVTISGADATQILRTGLSSKVTLERLTLAHGVGSDDGGFLAGGAIHALDSHLVIDDSTLAHNAADGATSVGGAVYTVGGRLSVRRSTFEGNSSDVGGAVLITRTDAQFIDSTFVSNVATNSGGAITTFQDPDSTTTRVLYSTFTGNSASLGGGAIAGDALLTADVFATNPADRDGSCAGAPFPPAVDLGYTVSDDATCATTGTSLPSTDPDLDPSGLADHGGENRTVALQDGSPAIDLIPQDQAGCADTVRIDQRGFGRPVNGDLDPVIGCDAGAYEVGATASPTGCTITGTAGDDVLRGTPHDDVICGFPGKDTIYGGGGNDTIYASSGRDVIHGGAGDDRIIGSEGRDLLLGGTGMDRLHGGADNDVLREGPGRDILHGGSGHDVLHP